MTGDALEARWGGSRTHRLLNPIKRCSANDPGACNVTIGGATDRNTRRDLALYYARNGTLRLAVWGGYDVDTEGGYVAGSYVANAASEFRYDDPRARYMSRNIDVSASDHEPCDPSSWTPIAPAAWTDYDGVMPYGDFDLDVDASGNGAITEKARYADGFGTFGRQLLDAQGQVAETRYLLGDLIRSTNLTTDGAGAAAQTVAYTAFGELVGEDGQGRTRIGADPPAGFPRYQYAGGWGYEADLLTLAGAPTSPLPPIRLLHVGGRWYQPDIGRFVMRDRMGIDGGTNVYVYGSNDPLAGVDPEGESWWPNKGFIRYGPSRIRFDGSGKGVYRLAWRYGPKVHVYGLRGAACFGSALAGAAATGAAAGTALDLATKVMTGRSPSDRIGRWIYDWCYSKDPTYDPEN